MLAVSEEQVPIIVEEFSPSEPEVAWARRVIADVAALDSSGENVTMVDGEIIEAPHVRAAEEILARHGGGEEAA
jgi:citrate lyase subunit beta/citryl-CoA lyase